MITNNIFSKNTQGGIVLKQKFSNSAIYLLLLINSLLWAGNFVFGKYLVGHSGPMTLTVYRWLIAVVIILPIVYIKEKRVLPPKDSILSLLVMGLTGVVFFNLFLFLAIEKTSSVNVGLLSSLNPVSIAIASYFLLRENLTKYQISGIIISLIGVVVVISKGNLIHLLELQFNAGDLYMILAVITWGLYSVAGRRSINFVSPYMSTLWSGIFGIIFIIPFSFSSLTIISNPNLPFWLSTAYTGIVGTVITTIVWNIGVEKIGGTKSSIFLNFNPIFTAILSYFILKEHITYAQIVGTLLVLAGVLIFYRRERATTNIE